MYHSEHQKEHLDILAFPTLITLRVKALVVEGIAFSTNIMSNLFLNCFFDFIQVSNKINSRHSEHHQEREYKRQLLTVIVIADPLSAVRSDAHLCSLLFTRCPFYAYTAIGCRLNVVLYGDSSSRLVGHTTALAASGWYDGGRRGYCTARPSVWSSGAHI